MLVKSSQLWSKLIKLGQTCLKLVLFGTGHYRKDIEFEVEDKVFLKVSPWKNILRFGRKGKLIPRFIGPYEILERVGPIAYRLALPLELAKLHDVFHVSMLQRYRSDTSHILPVQDIQVQEDFTFDKEPKVILDREIR